MKSKLVKGIPIAEQVEGLTLAGDIALYDSDPEVHALISID